MPKKSPHKPTAPIKTALVVYLAHPIGDTGSAEQYRSRQDNFENAGRWFRFLIASTSWVVVAPWAFYVTHLPGSADDPRRLVDQLYMIERCDMLLLAGGAVGPHMMLETKRARRCGVPILDLSTLGREPPDIGPSSRAQLLNKASRIMTGRARRVWMPLLTDDDIKALIEARDVLSRLEEDYEAALLLIERIIDAATDPFDNQGVIA